MTGRHAAPAAPETTFLADQIDAWIDAYDIHTARALGRDLSALATGDLEKILEGDDHERIVMLCTARQLLNEARRG